MIANSNKKFGAVSFESAIPNAASTTIVSKPAGQQAWERFKAASAADAYKASTTGQKKWEQFKYDSALKAENERKTMADIDYFDSGSLSSLGIGDIDFNALRKMAYDGKITVNNPGVGKRLTVSWAPGWDAVRYRQEPYAAMTNQRPVKPVGTSTSIQQTNAFGNPSQYAVGYPVQSQQPGLLEEKMDNATFDAIFAAKTGDTETLQNRLKFFDVAEQKELDGKYFTYRQDPEFDKYVKQGEGADLKKEFSTQWDNIKNDIGYMDKSERDMFYYLLGKYGSNEALSYRLQINDRISSREGKALAENAKDSLLRKLDIAIASGFTENIQGFTQNFFSDDIVPENSWQYANAYTAPELKGAEKVIYGIANQMANMAPMVLTTTIASAMGVPAPIVGLLGSTQIGLSARGNAYASALEEGYDKPRAELYATGVGLSEALFQYLLGGISKAGGIAADDLLTKVAAWDNALFRFAGTVAIKGGAEAIEENLQNFFEPLLRTMIFEEEYDVPTWEEILYTSLISFVTANLMESTETADITAHGAGSNVSKSESAKEMAQRLINASIEKVTGKKRAQSAQNAAESVSAEKGVVAQESPANVTTGAGASSTGVNSQSARDEALAATIRQGQENLARAEAEKKSDELTPQQKSFFDSFFGREKTVSESDTAKKSQNMSEVQEDSGTSEIIQPEPVQKVTAAPKVDTPEKNVPQVETEIQEVKAPGFYSNDLFTGTKSEQQYLDNLAKAVGVSMEMTRQDNGNNGWIVNGKVYISASAEDPVRVVAKHEITHRIQQAAPDAYIKYRGFVEQTLRQRGGLDAKIRAIQELYASRGQTLSREQALDELAADFAGELLENEDLIRKIAHQDRNLAQRILDAIRDVLRRIKTVFSDAETKTLDRAAHLWEDALREASYAYKRGNIETSSEKRYSVKHTKDNRPYVDVDVDQHLFKGLTTAEMQDAAKKIIKDRFKGQVIGAEYTAFVNKTSAEHFAYPASRRMDESVKRDKMQTATELDNLLRASRYRENVIPEEGKHPEATGGLDKLDVMYRVGPRAYEAEITVLVTDRGRVFYDMTKIKDITNREIGQIPGLGNAETEDDIYDDTVSQERRSVKGSRELQRRIDALERQNKRLKEQLKRTDVPKVRRDVVKRSAKDLRTMYSSGIDADTLTSRIEDLYNKIAKYSGAGTLQDVKGVPLWSEIKAEASSIAYAILADSSANTNTMAEEYSALKKELRGRKISISEEYRSDLESAGGYDGIRKQNFGTFTLSKDGTPIDIVYMELNEKYPELFPDDIFHPADQLIRLSDVVEDLKPIMGNPFEQDLDNTAEYLAGEIIERFYDTPNEKPTAADKMADAYHRQRIRDRREMRAALENQRKAYEEQAEELKRKYESENQNRIERQNAAQRRETIFRHASRLGKKLLRPTNNQHIPEELRGVAFELVKYINLESGFEYDFTKDAMYQRVVPGSVSFPVKTSRTLAALNLKKQLEEAAGNEAISIDPEMNDYLQELAEMGNKTLADMSKDELDTVWKVLQIVEHTISSANELHEQGRYKSVAAMAEAVERNVEGSTARRSFVGPVGALDKLVNFDMLTPETFLHKLGDAGDELFRMMRRSEDRQIEIIKNGVEAAQKLVQESGVNFKKLDKELHTFELAKGELTLSTSQIMELYALMNRKQAVDHILKGGLKSIGVAKGVVELRNSQPIHVNSNDVAEIVSVLTDNQKKLMDGLQKYLSTTLADYGNAETMKVYGYKKFKEPHYWPIKVARTEVASDPTSKVREKMIPGYGMTKLTQPKAKNPVELRSAMDSFAAHLNQMSTYAAWLGTNEDINRLINFKYLGSDLEVRDTAKRMIETVYGKNGEAYLDNLLGDIAQGTKAGRDKAITEALTGNWKAAKVGANLRVVVQQPTSIFRALDMLDPKYFAAGGSVKKGWEKAKKYSQIAQWKDWGYFEINTGRSLRELVVGTESAVDKIRNATMWAAGAADSATWGYLWNAVENETADLHPELSKGSDAFYKATAERFGQIIDRTQVVDSVLHRTQIMRSSNALDKMASNFMGEPSKIYNMVARSIVDLTNAKTEVEKKAAIRSTARTVAALTASFAVNALAQSLIDGLRDDDRDKKLSEKFVENYFGITGEEENFADAWSNFWGGNLWQNFNPFGYLPYVKDVMSLIQGYSVDRSDMASVTEIINAMRQFAKSIAGDGQKTVWATGFEALAKVADLLGIPVSNIKRDAVAILNTILNELDLFELQYELDKIVYSEENASGVFFGDIYRAMNEDVDAYVDIYEDYYEGLIDRGMTEDEAVDKVRDAMEKKMKDEIGVKSVKSLPVRWEPPTENDTADEKAKKFLQLLFDGEGSGGWASQFPKKVIEASKEIDVVVGDDKSIQKWLVVANGDWDEWIKELQLKSLMGDSEYSRYMSARNERISTEAYIKVLARAKEIANERGAKSVSQGDLKAALNESKLTKAQKRAIWNSYGWKTESPW